MSKPPIGQGSERDGDGERLLTRLFAHAQPRPLPPAADAEEIKRALYAEWDALTGRRLWYRRAGFAAASSAVLAIVLWAAIGTTPGVPNPAVASVERVQGAAGLALGDALAAGSVVTTATGQAALRLASGGSLRLGPDSRLTLVAADRAELVAGVLYFDSEGQRASAFTVTTPLGVVRDVGTQYLARVAGDALEVGVREGRVALVHGVTTSDAGAGERLVVTAGADVRREPAATVGRDWDWVERLAPPFDIDGRTLAEFLGWFERQTGRTVVYADANVEQLAAATVLNGSIDLEPMPKLAAVMTLTDLGYAVEGERIVIAPR